MHSLPLILGNAHSEAVVNHVAEADDPLLAPQKRREKRW